MSYLIQFTYPAPLDKKIYVSYFSTMGPAGPVFSKITGAKKFDTVEEAKQQTEQFKGLEDYSIVEFTNNKINRKQSILIKSKNTKMKTQELEQIEAGATLRDKKSKQDVTFTGRISKKGTAQTRSDKGLLLWKRPEDLEVKQSKAKAAAKDLEDLEKDSQKATEKVAKAKQLKKDAKKGITKTSRVRQLILKGYTNKEICQIVQCDSALAADNRRFMFEDGEISEDLRYLRHTKDRPEISQLPEDPESTKKHHATLAAQIK